MDKEVTDRIVALFARKLNDVSEAAAAARDDAMVERVESALKQALSEVGEVCQQALIDEQIKRRDVYEQTCDCGHPMVVKDLRTRKIYGRHGEFTVRRRYFICPSCAGKRLPLDERLNLEGRFTKTVEEMMALVGVMHSSRRASAVLETLSGLCISSTTIMRYTASIGQEAHRHVINRPAESPLPPECLCAYVSADGVMVNTLSGWREMRLGCLYDDDGYRRYVAALADSNEFGRMLRQMVCLAGGQHAHELVAIADGAHWIWEQVRTRLPFTNVEIVDFYHAAQQLADVARCVYGEGTPYAARWLKDKLKTLGRGGSAALLKKLRNTAAYRRGDAEMRRVAGYFKTHARRTNYPFFQKQGYDIGSGTIESACKNVVQARLKGPGMRWREDTATAVASLRALLLSDHWEDFHESRRVA